MPNVSRARPMEQATWAAALRLRTFTCYSLAADVHLGADVVREIVADWRRSGAVIEIGRGDKNRLRFAVKEGQTELPRRTRRDGTYLRTSTAQGNMWRAMRGLGTFTPTDLAAHSNTTDVTVSVEDALAYCQMLVRSAHIRVQRKGLPGRREAVYRLIRNTGPHAPCERRIRAVWDENLQEYAHIADGGRT